jgi:hypothetical protein
MSERDGWCVYQMAHPQCSEGLVFAYRLTNTPATFTTFLRELAPAQTYALTHYPDDGSTAEVSGRQLMEEGLTLTLPYPGMAMVCVLRPQTS